eukprot:gene17832-21234_t
MENAHVAEHRAETSAPPFPEVAAVSTAAELATASGAASNGTRAADAAALETGPREGPSAEMAPTTCARQGHGKAQPHQRRRRARTALERIMDDGNGGPGSSEEERSDTDLRTDTFGGASLKQAGNDEAETMAEGAGGKRKAADHFVVSDSASGATSGASSWTDGSQDDSQDDRSISPASRFSSHHEGRASELPHSMSEDDWDGLGRSPTPPPLVDGAAEEDAALHHEGWHRERRRSHADRIGGRGAEESDDDEYEEDGMVVPDSDMLSEHSDSSLENKGIGAKWAAQNSIGEYGRGRRRAGVSATQRCDDPIREFQQLREQRVQSRLHVSSGSDSPSDMSDGGAGLGSGLPEKPPSPADSL